MVGNIDMVLESVENPDYIVHGWTDELIALKHYDRTVDFREIYGIKE